MYFFPLEIPVFNGNNVGPDWTPRLLQNAVSDQGSFYDMHSISINGLPPFGK